MNALNRCLIDFGCEAMSELRIGHRYVQSKTYLQSKTPGEMCRYGDPVLMSVQQVRGWLLDWV